MTNCLMPMRAGLILAACAYLTGCARETVAIKTVIARPTPPASAVIPCAKPVTLPASALSAARVTALWGKDRKELLVCETKRAALAFGMEN